ncbi:MAG: glycosyltransferase [Elusimicrobiales bacterium]|nr:glycosyltransferase [Elusimicrobiales bacterium]
MYKILFTGNYDPYYNRTLILKKGLKKLNHTIIEYPFKRIDKNSERILKKYIQESDFIFCPFASHKQVPYIRKIANGKLIIFDPLISLYMTHVNDYKKHFFLSIDALLYYIHDKKSLNSADLIISDTKQHALYYHKKYNIPLNKIHTLYIGNDFDIFYPLKNPKKNKKFNIGFYGLMAPLQGIDNIIKAANIIKNKDDINFIIIGEGYEYNKVKKLIQDLKLDNIQLLGKVNYYDLNQLINNFDIALGIFGDTKKADLVIPNKIFHYMACMIPTLTKDTLAIREIFENGKNILLCSSKPVDIAEKIIYLKENINLRLEISKNGFEKIKQNFNEIKTAEKFIEIAESAYGNI